MVKIQKTITIYAPVEKVFSYLEDPINLLEIWPSLMEIKDVQRLPNGVGSNWHWVYKMAGMRFEGNCEVAEYIPNRRIVMKTKGGIESTQTATLQPDSGGTKVIDEVEYTVPIPLLGKLIETFIVKQNEHEAELFLANLKVRMET